MKRLHTILPVLALCGCAHFGSSWDEAKRALEHVDTDRIMACSELERSLQGPCVGARVKGAGVSYLLDRGAELIRSLLLSHSGAGAQADAMNDDDVKEALAELDAVLTLLEADGAELRD